MKRAASGETGPPPEPRLSPWRRLAKRIWGYDFFVSYNWASGGQYAVVLAEKLRERGYDCFLDQSEFAAGDDWRREAQSALRNTGRLVVIATREAIAGSEAVQHEIELFTSRSERVIPIVFGSRFADEEKLALPALSRIPESTIDLVEEEDRLEKGPSGKILDQIIQAHRLVRRRSVRAFIVTAAMVILAIAALIATRYGLVARSAALVNKANLQRETEGPKLEESLGHAEEAKALAMLAMSDAGSAVTAIEAARRLLPERRGAASTPVSEPTASDSLITGGGYVALLRPDKDPFAVVVDTVAAGDERQGTVVRQFFRADRGEYLASDQGWIFTRRNDELILWHISEDEEVERLGCGVADEIELLAASCAPRHPGAPATCALLVRCDERPSVRLAGETPARSRPVPVQVSPVGPYAVSRSGGLGAWAELSELVVLDLASGETLLRYPIAQRGGHLLSVGFIERPLPRWPGARVPGPAAVYASWSANQVVPVRTGGRSDDPSHQAAVWSFPEDLEIFAPLGGPGPSDGAAPGTHRGRITPPDIRLVREKQFDLVVSEDTRYPSLAVVDPGNPVQWIDLDSQLSFTLGSLPATRARFRETGADEAPPEAAEKILVVHEDGTARQWSLKSREEELRFTGSGSRIRDGVYVTGSLQHPVTLDEKGRLQAWSSHSVLDVESGLLFSLESLDPPPAPVPAEPRLDKYGEPQQPVKGEPPPDKYGEPQRPVKGEPKLDKYGEPQGSDEGEPPPETR